MSAKPRFHDPDFVFVIEGVMCLAGAVVRRCGIGTQALGLAALGHKVTASDLSAGAVARAGREAAKRQLHIELSVADMRECSRHHESGYDVVLSADNSLPHLETGSEIRSTLKGMHDCLNTGGIAIVGIRDYSQDEDRSSPQFRPYGFRYEGGSRYFVFQTRDWEGSAYNVGMYFVREATSDSRAGVICGLSRYYAITVDELCAHFESVGFRETHRLDDVIYQPLVVGVRGGT